MQRTDPGPPIGGLGGFPHFRAPFTALTRSLRRGGGTGFGKGARSLAAALVFAVFPSSRVDPTGLAKALGGTKEAELGSCTANRRCSRLELSLDFLDPRASTYI